MDRDCSPCHDGDGAGFGAEVSFIGFIPAPSYSQFSLIYDLCIELCVLCFRLLLTNKDKYDSVLTTRLEIHIKMALGKICYYIAMANTDLNLSGLTNLTYEILYGAPLMVELGKEISTFVADAMILNAKEVVYDSTKSLTALQGPPADEEAEKEGPFYMDFSKELVFIGQSRVYLNLPTIIENCVQKLTVEFTDFPSKDSLLLMESNVT